MTVQTRSPSAQFVEGWVTFVRIIGGARYVWWGRDESGEDYLGTVEGRVAAYETAEEAVALVQSRGWNRNAHLEVWGELRLPDRLFCYATRARSSVSASFGALARVRGRSPLDADSAINLWNFGEDVLRSTSGDALTSGPATDGLHAHLTETAAPYLARRGRPRAWSAADLKRLRAVLERAGRIVENAMLTPPARSRR